jgi:hypothetical protein
LPSDTVAALLLSTRTPAVALFSGPDGGKTARYNGKMAQHPRRSAPVERNGQRDDWSVRAMSTDKSNQRPPRPIKDSEIRAVFERHGYETTSKKEISIDVYDILVPLLTMSQWCQWWGQLLSANGVTIDHKMDTDELFGVSVHSASVGQKIGLVQVNTVDSVLNMLSSWVGNLRAYGQNPELRAERINDSDDSQIPNEYLDSVAPLMLEIMALALPASPISPTPKSPDVR